MNVWISLALDVILIGLVGAGLVQASRLLRQLAELRQSRVEMERFVQDFNATVMRAEAGIKGLRQTARDSGDDLENLLGKANSIREELQFIIESADQIASRLTQNASSAVRAPEAPPEMRAEARVPAKPAMESSPAAAPLPARKLSAAAASRAEQELMQVLEKLG